jgi:hypothetical protein
MPSSEDAMRFLLLASMALALTGCISIGSRYSDIETGMTRAQVIDAMEDCPSTVQTAGKYEARTYGRRMMSFFQWAPADYTFIFKDGVLTEFGKGTARRQNINGEPGLVLVPPPAA